MKWYVYHNVGFVCCLKREFNDFQSALNYVYDEITKLYKEMDKKEDKSLKYPYIVEIWKKDTVIVALPEHHYPSQIYVITTKSLCF